MSKAAKKARRGTTADMMVALSRRYPENAYARMGQVTPGTGHAGTTGYADFIAVSLWPSRGLEIIGHELKASRSDWLREYKNPKKNSAFIKYCHRWYLVVSGEGIVEPGELPANWGLLMLRGGVLRELTGAPTLEPTPLDLPFFCALVRRATGGMVTTEEANAKAEGRYQAGFEDGQKSLTAPQAGEAATYREAYDKMIKHVRAFEEASGLDFSHAMATPGLIGAMAKILHDHREYDSWVEHARKRLDAAQAEADAYADMLKKFSDLSVTLPKAPWPGYKGPTFEELIGAPKAAQETDDV